MISPLFPKQLPIGVFDSGVGGLTVLRELHRIMPHERFLYLGDTARVPYGSKSPDTVRDFSLQIGAWLAQHPVKAIVVACNTASALALPVLHERLPVPVFGVIQPGAAAAVACSKTAIGVLATRATIASDAYRAAIHRIDPARAVTSIAAPLLVPLIEEGELTGDIARLILEKYLQPLRENGCDTVLLGCTHYPLIKKLIASQWHDVNTIDSAEATALVVHRELSHRKLCVPDTTAVITDFSNVEMYLTDTGGQFIKVAETFLGTSSFSVSAVSIEALERAYSDLIK